MFLISQIVGQVFGYGALLMISCHVITYVFHHHTMYGIPLKVYTLISYLTFDNEVNSLVIYFSEIPQSTYKLSSK